MKSNCSPVPDPSLPHCQRPGAYSRAASRTGSGKPAPGRRLHAETLPRRAVRPGRGRVARCLAAGRFWAVPGLQRTWRADRAVCRTARPAFRGQGPETASRRLPPSHAKNGFSSRKHRHGGGPAFCRRHGRPAGRADDLPRGSDPSGGGAVVHPAETRSGTLVLCRQEYASPREGVRSYFRQRPCRVSNRDRRKMDQTPDFVALLLPRLDIWARNRVE